MQKRKLHYGSSTLSYERNNSVMNTTLCTNNLRTERASYERNRGIYGMGRKEQSKLWNAYSAIKGPNQVMEGTKLRSQRNKAWRSPRGWTKRYCWPRRSLGASSCIHLGQDWREIVPKRYWDSVEIWEKTMTKRVQKISDETNNDRNKSQKTLFPHLHSHVMTLRMETNGENIQKRKIGKQF